MAAAATATSGIANRYAGALYDLADEKKALDETAEDLRDFGRMIDESDDLRRMIRSPLLGRDEQAKAVTAILEKAGASRLVRNFAGVVARNRRLFAMPDIIQAFLRLLATRRGEVPVTVTSALALSDVQVERLREQLKGTVGDKIALDLEVDPEILGGLIVKVGSRMVDSSLRTQLQRLQIAMRGAG